MLSVRGRSSGEWRETPVNPLRVAGQRYLVAPRGHTQWVRNLRVAGGGRLTKGRQVEDFTAVEIADADKPPILREYLRVWAWEVGRFFEGVDASSSDERLLEIAPDFPVFRINGGAGRSDRVPRRRVRHPLEPADPRPGRRLHARDPRPRPADGRGRGARRQRTAAADRRPGHARRACPAPRDLRRAATWSSTRPACATSSTRPAAPHGGAAAWLQDAAHPGEPDPALEYRRIENEAGPVIALPVIAGDPDWHISPAPVVVYGRDGAIAGVLDGFGELYRVWLAHLVRELRGADAGRPVVVICESRQLGELLVGWDDPEVRLVHAIHTVHLEPPYQPDGPLNPLWTRWFTVAERFDAVLWPTAMQRSEVQERFGASPVHVVVPHAVPAAASVAPLSARDPGRVVMLNRLAPGKRIDHAIVAFEQVVREVPGATLDIYGEGAEHDALQALIDARGLGAHVVLRGRTDDPGAVLDAASVFLSTSAFEGQGLSLAEALAHGCPVIAYDVPVRAARDPRPRRRLAASRRR